MSTKGVIKMTQKQYDKLVQQAARKYMQHASGNLSYGEVQDITEFYSFSLVEAAQIIEDFSENVEGDYSLWEGQPVDDALKSKAYWSFNNDVISRILVLMKKKSFSG